ncbi:MAG TPA: serine hydrolase [Hyphomicrobiaceae bacterium]|nr:serine hydrolase [Hyphomicrobiaceae bacterium]
MPNRRQVLLGTGTAIAAALACTSVSTAQELRSSDIMYPTLQWEILEPSAAGWSTDLLDKAQTYAAASGSSAVMIVHNGRVIAEWGDTHRRSDMASVRKSLLSALLGIAIEEGRVKLSDTLANLGINDKPPSLTSSEMQATLADLLTSRSGVYHPIDLEPAAVAAQRPRVAATLRVSSGSTTTGTSTPPAPFTRRLPPPTSSPHSNNASPNVSACRISAWKPATTARPKSLCTGTTVFA